MAAGLLLPTNDRIHQRFKDRKIRRRLAAIVYLASAIVYLGWRLTIFNEYAPVLSSMYFVADVIAVLLAALTIFVSWHYKYRKVTAAPVGLSVDVFIPVYREPVDMIRRTLAAARDIEYPHVTWLLDDGCRPELRRLAEELDCRYLAREDNSGAKAGNLNHALTRSKGEFVAVFDADHIPQPNCLHRLLGFFRDPKVGMVQAPQDYYNTDAIQFMNADRSGALWHDQSFFYNLSQPGRDYMNAASCAGTSVVYRRSALEAIGGIPEETVTEDVHTSLKMHKSGYTVPYLNESVAYGVAASDLSDYYRTRLRYGHGNIHALRHENVLFCKGLDWRQRISYLFLGLIYLEGWQQLLVFLVPCIALIVGIAPFDITIFNVLVVLLFPIWSYLLIQEVGCGFSRYWTSEIFSMMRFPVHLIAAMALFANKMKWRVSRKDIHGRLQLLLLAPQIIVVVASLVAVGVGVYRLDGVYKPGPLLHAVNVFTPSVDEVRDQFDRRIAQLRMMFAPEPEMAPADEEIVVAEVPPSVREKGSMETAGAEGTESSPSGTPPETARKPADSGQEVINSEPSVQAPAEPLETITETGEADTDAEAVLPPEAEPVQWFQPLITGYSIDLVLIAGFWALINAARALLVISKVYGSARRSGKAYFFKTLLPMAVETPDGKIYTRVERLTKGEIVLERKLPIAGARRASATPLDARLYLPEGMVDLSLEPATSRHGKQFRITARNALDEKRLEDVQYATAWHRFCRHYDANFLTPIGWLLDLVTFRLGKRRRQKARLFLFRQDYDPEGAYERLAVAVGNGRKAKVYSANQHVVEGREYDALEITSRGARPTRLSVNEILGRLDVSRPGEVASMQTYRAALHRRRKGQKVSGTKALSEGERPANLTAVS